MAVYKRVTCPVCKGEIAQVAVEPDASKFTCRKGCKGLAKVSSNWYVAAYLVGCDGKKHKHTKSIGTKKKAEEYERKLLTEREDGESHTKRKDWSFSAFEPEFDAWISQRVIEEKMSPQTARAYRLHIRAHIIPWIGSVDIRKINTAMLDGYKLSRMKVVANSSTNRTLAVLKRSLTIAVNKGWIKVNPAQGYELLKETESDRYLTTEEITALLAACCDSYAPKHLAYMILLSLNTGLRHEGVTGLEWEHIKWEQREIHRVVKGKKLVRIPMTQALITALQTWQEESGATSKYVFPSRRTGKAITVQSNFGFTRVARLAGLEGVTFHTLRHTFATHFLEQHPDMIEVLARILGHSGAYMSRRYAHITDKLRHSAMETFTMGDFVV